MTLTSASQPASAYGVANLTSAGPKYVLEEELHDELENLSKASAVWLVEMFLTMSKHKRIVLDTSSRGVVYYWLTLEFWPDDILSTLSKGSPKVRAVQLTHRAKFTITQFAVIETHPQFLELLEVAAPLYEDYLVVAPEQTNEPVVQMCIRFLPEETPRNLGALGV